MIDPCIICVAITGSVPTKKDNPAVPISIPEQIESTQECFEIGASIVHCHVRNDDGTPSIDPDKYRLLKEGIEKTLLEKVPELKGVKDITDHSENENAYYK